MGLPVLAWLPRYRLGDLPRDALAGFLGTLGAAPAAMAFALVAGLPVQAGLYSLLLPALVYFLLGTSREIAVGPTPTLAALAALVAAPLAGAPESRVAVVLAATWLLGALLLLFGVLRFGFVASFVSRPVLVGYASGVALLVAGSQLTATFGVEAEGFEFSAIVSALATVVREARGPKLLLGVGLLVLLAVTRRSGLGSLGAPLAVAAGTAAVAWLGLDVEVIGRIPAGVPSVSWPEIGEGQLEGLLFPAIPIALLVFLDTATAERKFARGKGYRPEPNQELRALGLANLAAGFSGGAPVAADVTGTVLLDRAGARSPIAGLVTMALVLVLVVFGANFSNVPVAAFSAIVVFGVLRPPDLAVLRRTWRFDRAEFVLGCTAFAGVMAIGVLRGLVLALALTAFVLLARASRPHLVELGLIREPHPDLVDREHEPRARRIPGAVIVQPVGALFFASAPAAVGWVRDRVLAKPAGIDRVLFDLRTVPFVDLTACELLEELDRDLGRQGIRLLLVRAVPEVEEHLRRYGLDRLLADGQGLEALLEAAQAPRDARDLT